MRRHCRYVGYHITGVVTDICIRMGGVVIKEVDKGFHGGLCSFELCHGKYVESVKHGGINSSGIKKEGYDGLL
jgi:hypothetical protein